MIRRPFGSIDPNSIRETELHTESRRGHGRGERESLHSPQLDRERDAAHARASVCTLLLHAPGVLSPVCGSTLRVSHDMTIKGNTEYIRA